MVANVDDEVVMLQPATSQYYGLEGTGARIWALLDEPRSIGDMVANLVAQYEVDEATCLAEVVSFVTELAESGLVDATPAVS